MWDGLVRVTHFWILKAALTGVSAIFMWQTVFSKLNFSKLTTAPSTFQLKSKLFITMTPVQFTIPKIASSRLEIHPSHHANVIFHIWKFVAPRNDEWAQAAAATLMPQNNLT
jgi:hypothetical protein